MYSILAEIDRYIKKKGIPFESVSFNYSYLPKYINQAILNDLRVVENNGFNGVEVGPEKYTLKYDTNGNLCLVIIGRDQRTKLVVANSNSKIDLGYPVTKVSEGSIIKKACMLEQMDETIQKCYKKIKSSMKDSKPSERLKLENEIANILLSSNSTKFSDDMVDIVVLSESVKKITDYIDYLNLRYLEEMQYQNENPMSGISYIEPESDRIFRRNPGTISDVAKERINTIIPADDRLKVLDSFRPIFREYAYSETDKEIDYINYLYRLSPSKLVIVMEPYSGIKYTKIAIIDYKGVMSYEEFREEVKKYLELSYSELNNLGNVVRSSHTTLHSFKKMLQFTLKNEEEEFTNEFFKGKVRKLKEQQ